MYYDIIKQKTGDELCEYLYEIVDDRPRCSWYRLVENAFYTLQIMDDRSRFEIITEENAIDYSAEALIWIFENDIDAFLYLLQKRIPPVPSNVKKRMMEKLDFRGYHGVSVTLKYNLKEFKYSPTARYTKIKILNIELVRLLMNRVKSSSAVISNFKLTPEFYERMTLDINEELFLLFLCNPGGLLQGEMKRILIAMRWLLQNEKAILDELCDVEVIWEVKKMLLFYCNKCNEIEVANYLYHRFVCSIPESIFPIPQADPLFCDSVLEDTDPWYFYSIE